MTITIQSTANIGAFTTEQPNLIIKSETAFVRICDNGKFKKLVIGYSYEQNLNTLTINHSHN